MEVVFGEMEKQVLMELRKWAEAKYKKSFELMDYETVLNEFWKEKLK
jgi:hypothetical protein